MKYGFLLFALGFFSLQSCGEKNKPEKDSQARDTTDLETKARFIWDTLQTEYPMMGGCDTLMDVNGDGVRDLVIEHYGRAGSGMKWLVTLYLYHPEKGQFEENEQLHSIRNPTFDIKNNTVFSWYLANGGGFSTKMEWNIGKKSLDTLEYTEIQVLHDNPLKFKFSRTDYRTSRTTTWTNNKIPPECNYDRIIKRPECN